MVPVITFMMTAVSRDNNHGNGSHDNSHDNDHDNTHDNSSRDNNHDSNHGVIQSTRHLVQTAVWYVNGYAMT